MSPRVLWPQTYWQDDLKPERDGLGAGVEPVFRARIADVTDDEWRTCDGIVGAQPPADKLDLIERCRIYVKLGVGYDDIDLKGLGERGIPVCNVPDYGTREVADHAMPQKAEASAKPARPIRKMDLRPKMSPSLPPVIRNTA